MDIASLVVGIIVGVIIALVWTSFAERSNRKASRIEAQSLARNDTGDVLADADKRMAHGYYEDAAKLVANAVSSEPGRLDLKLKLLELYFIWGKQSEFLGVAQEYRRDLSSTPEWSKVQVMGKQLCPQESLFD